MSIAYIDHAPAPVESEQESPDITHDWCCCSMDVATCGHVFAIPARWGEDQDQQCVVCDDLWQSSWWACPGCGSTLQWCTVHKDEDCPSF